MSWNSEPNTPAGHISDKPEKFSLSGTPNLLKKFLFPEEKKVDKTKKPAKPLKKTLPENFTNDLMEYELEIEREIVDIEVVNKLTELYLTAMEFYQGDDHKYKVFEKKFQGLLLKPNVQASMNLATTLESVQDTEKEKLLRMQSIEAEAAKVNKERVAFDIVNDHERQVKTSTKIITNDLNKQKQSIKDRLEQRKAKKASRATSLPPYELENPSDSSPLKAPSSTNIDSSALQEPNTTTTNPPAPKHSRRESRFYKMPIPEEEEDRANTPPKSGHEVKHVSNSARRPSRAGDLLPGALADRRNSRKESFSRDMEGRTSRSDSSRDSRKSILVNKALHEVEEVPENKEKLFSPPISPEHNVEEKIDHEGKKLIVLHTTEVAETIKEKSNSSDSSDSSDSEAEEEKNKVQAQQPEETKQIHVVEPEIETIENKDIEEKGTSDVKLHEPSNISGPQVEIIETQSESQNEQIVLQTPEAQGCFIDETPEIKAEEPLKVQEPIVEQNNIQEPKPEVIQAEEERVIQNEENPVVVEEEKTNVVEPVQAQEQQVEALATGEIVVEESNNEPTEKTNGDLTTEDPFVEQPKTSDYLEETITTNEATNTLEQPLQEVIEPIVQRDKPIENIEPASEIEESKEKTEHQISPQIEENKPENNEIPQQEIISKEEPIASESVPIEEPLVAETNETIEKPQENEPITSEPITTQNEESQSIQEHIQQSTEVSNEIPVTQIQEEAKTEVLEGEKPIETVSESQDGVKVETKVEEAKIEAEVEKQEEADTVSDELEKKEPSARSRVRRESEEIEIKKLEALRRIEAEQEKELEEFKVKQAADLEKKLDDIDKKYQDKLAAGEGNAESLESEKQAEIKSASLNCTKEIEKFKKKLQMQKMFKMNQLVS